MVPIGGADKKVMSWLLQMLTSGINLRMMKLSYGTISICYGIDRLFVVVVTLPAPC